MGLPRPFFMAKKKSKAVAVSAMSVTEDTPEVNAPEILTADPQASPSSTALTFERNGITMSCSSAVFIANNVSAPVAANAAIPLGTIQRRYGCALNAASGGISINQRGYYLVNATITFTAPAAGVVAVSLQDNGQQVVGVTAAESVTTANTEQHTIALTGIVRSLSGSDILTLVNTGIACTPSIVSINVVKL